MLNAHLPNQWQNVQECREKIRDVIYEYEQHLELEVLVDVWTQ